MKKAVLITLMGIFLLFGVGLVAYFHMFQHLNHILADMPGDPRPAPGEMSWNAYKKVRIEIGSFDLANGLTKHDLEAMGADNNVGFYYLMGCLWLVFGLGRGFKRPTKKKSGPLAGQPRA
jgi:hypothetical protein